MIPLTIFINLILIALRILPVNSIRSRIEIIRKNANEVETKESLIKFPIKYTVCL